MPIEQFVFYVLAIVAVASSVMVISARNPVHSVLFLILTFFNAAGLFVRWPLLAPILDDWARTRLA